MKSKIILLPLFALILSSCDMLQPQTPAPPTTRTISYQLPVFTPVDPNKQTQETDGVRVTVSPYNYDVKEFTRQEVHPVPSLLVMNNQYPADLTLIPYLEVVPKQLRFKITIVNHLDHVVRMAGTAVAFSIAGKTIAVDQSGYSDFLNGMILPQQEGDYEVSGPDLSVVSDNSTIGLFLYDMVTATDAAGNPTKRTNFEFYYTVSRQQKSQDVPVTVRRVMLDPSGHIIGSP